MKEEFFFNSRNLKISSVLHKSENNEKIIVMCHGLMSRKDRPKLIELGRLLSKNGISFLRFDFSGCGNSQASSISSSNQIDDLKSAIKFTKDKGYKKIGLIGESFGGFVSILSYSDEIRTMVLWAPLTNSKIHPSWTENHELIEKRGFIDKEKKGKKYRLSKEFFIETNSINQKKILSRVKCPVLIIHGDKDDIIPLKDSKSAIKYLSKKSKLIEIAGSDHFVDNNKRTLTISLNCFREKL